MIPHQVYNPVCTKYRLLKHTSSLDGTDLSNLVAQSIN